MKKITLIAIATLVTAFSFAQEKAAEMFGKILDENNKPIKGVTITLKRTKLETKTYDDGRYFFTLPAEKGVLIYSHPKYETKEMEFTGTPQATDLILVSRKKKKPSKI